MRCLSGVFLAVSDGRLARFGASSVDQIVTERMRETRICTRDYDLKKERLIRPLTRLDSWISAPRSSMRPCSYALPDSKWPFLIRGKFSVRLGCLWPGTVPIAPPEWTRSLWFLKAFLEVNIKKGKTLTHFDMKIQTMSEGYHLKWQSCTIILLLS